MIDELFREALDPYRTARPRRGRIWRGIATRIKHTMGSRGGWVSLGGWLYQRPVLDPRPSLCQLVRVAPPHSYAPSPMVSMALTQLLDLRAAS